MQHYFLLTQHYFVALLTQTRCNREARNSRQPVNTANKTHMPPRKHCPFGLVCVCVCVNLLFYYSGCNKLKVFYSAGGSEAFVLQLIKPSYNPGFIEPAGSSDTQWGGESDATFQNGTVSATQTEIFSFSIFWKIFISAF